MKIDFIRIPWSTWTPKTESESGRGSRRKLAQCCSPNLAPKRVGFDLFLSLGQKWRGVQVEDVGNTCTCPPINFFGPPCLPCIFNTLFDPCMYFWKWQWTHIMVQHQFIKCIKYNHGKGCFTCESKVANVVESRHVMSSSFSDTNWYEPARVNPDLSMREGR